MFSKSRIKYPACFILTAALCLASALCSFAAQGKINFSDPAVTAGSEVNVTMKISADEGTALGSANVVLTYPTDKLEFVSGTDSDGGAGAIRVHGATNGSGTALLEYNLKFNTLSAGTAEIKVDSYEVYDTSDQVVELTHVGSSLVTVNAENTASSDSSLSALDVYPGELSPQFSADTDTYSVTVGSSVDTLTINAIPADSSSSVTITGNDALPMGDSAVTISVNAADGTSSKTYTVNVSKVEGGPEAVVGETETAAAEGVQLSSKGKTITIMSPDENVAIPEGFKQGTIKIDDQKVQGWVWGADEDPEYCVVYGMNDKGELNFYRYDMVEKTIQRYFEDPIAVGSVSNAEYSALMDEKDAAVSSSSMRFVIICVLAAICFIMAMGLIYLYSKLNALGRSRTSSLRAAEERARRRRYGDEAQAAKSSGAEGFDESEILKHDFTGEDDASDASEQLDETQVIRRPERKRRARRVVLNEDNASDTEDAVQPDTGTESAEALPEDTGSAGETDADAADAAGTPDEGGDGISELDI